MPHLRKILVTSLLLALVACEISPPRLELDHQLTELLPLAKVVESETGAVPRQIPGEGHHSLFVPFGSRIDYYLRLAPSSGLRIERLASSGEAAGRLQLRLATDSDGESAIADLSADDVELELRLTDDRPLAARLSLLAVTDDGEPSPGGLTLTRPEIWRPRASPVPESEGAFAPAPPNTAFEADRTPNVIIFLVDTLRPDHLGAYGYHRPTSPNFDRFTQRAHLFEYAVGQSPWTRPSIASIFTGMTPQAHGTISKKSKLDAELPVLAEILSRAGYSTTGVFSNVNGSPAFGFGRGFNEKFKVTPSGSEPARLAAEWVRDYAGERPFFLYVHTSEPHQPYLASKPFREQFAPDADEIAEIFERNPTRQIWRPTKENLRHLRGLYDAEIAEMDSAFGDLLGQLEDRQLLDPALMLYVSDHGEEFYEHKRWGHGRSMAVEQLNVALAIKFPYQREDSRVTDAVQHIDILPTILDHLGLPIPPTVEGRSLTTLADEAESSSYPPLTPIFSHNNGRRQYSVLAGDYKLSRRRSSGEVKLKGLYNWRRDPRELDNLLAERPILAAVLNALIERHRLAFASVDSEDAVLDDRVRDELRALGYLE